MRCPTDPIQPDGQPHTIIGCGSTNVVEDESEPGMYDCLDCGIWFKGEAKMMHPPCICDRTGKIRTGGHTLACEYDDIILTRKGLSSLLVQAASVGLVSNPLNTVGDLARYLRTYPGLRAYVIDPEVPDAHE